MRVGTGQILVALTCFMAAGCAQNPDLRELRSHAVPAAPAVVTVVPDPPPPVAPATEYAPEDLVGLDSAAVELLLGEPGLRRREPTAQVWQYVNAECVLLVFLYEGESGFPRVAHAETGGRTEHAVPDPVRCVSDLAWRQGMKRG